MLTKNFILSKEKNNFEKDPNYKGCSLYDYAILTYKKASRQEQIEYNKKYPKKFKRNWKEEDLFTSQPISVEKFVEIINKNNFFYNEYNQILGITFFENIEYLDIELYETWKIIEINKKVLFEKYEIIHEKFILERTSRDDTRLKEEARLGFKKKNEEMNPEEKEIALEIEMKYNDILLIREASLSFSVKNIEKIKKLENMKNLIENQLELLKQMEDIKHD